MEQGRKLLSASPDDCVDGEQICRKVVYDFALIVLLPAERGTHLPRKIMIVDI